MKNNNLKNKPILGNEIKKIRITNSICLCILILFLIIISAIGLIPFLSENQTLYFSSTLAQVSATLYGLVITAYVFLEGKLTKDAEIDDTLLDIVAELKTTYRQILLSGGIITGIALLLCVINIIVGDYSEITTQDVYNKLLRLVLNCSFTFSIASIVCSLYFTYQATDPNRIKKASKKGIKENKYSTKILRLETQKNHLADFMIDYNHFEQIINTFVNERKKTSTERPILNKNIYFLRNNAIISNDLFLRLQEMRQFRNFLVHGDDMFVDESTLKILRDLIEETKKAFEQINDKMNE